MRESFPRRLAAPPAHRLREFWRAVCVALADAAPTSPTTSPKSSTPRFFSDDRLLNNRSRALGTVHPARGRSAGGRSLRSRRGASEARRTCGTASGLGAGGVAREFARCFACDALCDLRVASASTLRIASSSARRSLVICASKSAGWFERSCATSASRARSYSARRASPVARVQPLDGAADERIIIGHGLRLRSVCGDFHSDSGTRGNSQPTSG